MMVNETLCGRRLRLPVFHCLAVWLLPCAYLGPVTEACTSFALKDGDRTLLGTNFDNDFKPGMLYVNKRGVRKTGWVLDDHEKAASWTSQYGSLTVHTAPYQFAWAGINETGLAISTMQLGGTEVPPPDERPSLISAAWVQYILDTCATVDEIVAADKQVRLSYGVDHYLACDATGKCVIIEFIGGRTVYHRKAELPVKVLANGPYAEFVARRDRDTAKLTTRAVLVDRMTRAERMLRSYDPQGAVSGIEYAFQILKKVAFDDTTWSLVFDLKAKSMVFRTYKNSRLRRIDLSALDFSCGTPVKMLNIHAKLSGDIAGKLNDYSHDDTLRHALQAVRFHMSDISDETVRQLLALIEGYDCHKTD